MQIEKIGNYTTGGPQRVWFLRTQGTVLLKNRTNRGLVLKSGFMTFKVPFFAHFYEKTVLNQGIRTIYLVRFVNRNN